MNSLTAEQVLFVHSRLVAEAGGSHGVGDLGLLESTVARPRATFDGKELYPDLFTKAAARMDSLINNHPFKLGTSARESLSQAYSYGSTVGNLTASLEDLGAVTLCMAKGDGSHRLGRLAAR